MKWKEVLNSETGGQAVYDHLTSTFSDFLLRRLVQAWQAAVYHKDAVRANGEGMLGYTARKRTLLKEIDKELGAKLHTDIKGTIMTDWSMPSTKPSSHFCAGLRHFLSHHTFSPAAVSCSYSAATSSASEATR